MWTAQSNFIQFIVICTHTKGFAGKFVELRLMSQLSIFLEYLIFMQKFYFPDALLGS